MKKSFLSLALAIGLLTASESFAGGNDVKFSTLEDARFRLSFSNPAQRSIIAIKDENGRILYSETVPRNNQYLKVFDFNNLGDGKYTLEVSRGKERVLKPFEIATKTTRSIVAVAD